MLRPPNISQLQGPGLRSPSPRPSLSPLRAAAADREETKSVAESVSSAKSSPSFARRFVSRSPAASSVAGASTAQSPAAATAPPDVSDPQLRLLDEMIPADCMEKRIRRLKVLAELSKTAKAAGQRDLLVSSALQRDVSELTRELKEQKHSAEPLAKALSEHSEAQNWDHVLATIGKLWQEFFPVDLLRLFSLMGQNQQAASTIKGKKTILLLGNTGAGKSTFTHFLSGSKFEMNEVGAPVPVQGSWTKPQLDSVKVAMTSESVTSTIQPVPVTYYEMMSSGESDIRYKHDADANAAVYLVDAPGLLDTGGLEIDIANGVSMVSALEEAESVQVVFFVHKQTVGARWENLETHTKAVTGMIREFEGKVDGVFVVFTGFELHEKGALLAALSDLLDHNSQQPEKQAFVAFLHHIRDGLQDTGDDGAPSATAVMCHPKFTGQNKKIAQSLFKLRRGRLTRPAQDLQPYLSSPARTAIERQMSILRDNARRAVSLGNFPLIKVYLDQLNRLAACLNRFSQSYHDEYKAACVSLRGLMDDRLNESSGLLKLLRPEYPVAEDSLIKLRDAIAEEQASQTLRREHLEDEASDALLSGLLSEMGKMTQQFNQLPTATEAAALRTVLVKLELIQEHFGECLPQGHQEPFTKAEGLLGPMLDKAIQECEEVIKAPELDLTRAMEKCVGTLGVMRALGDSNPNDIERNFRDQLAARLRAVSSEFTEAVGDLLRLDIIESKFTPSPNLKRKISVAVNAAQSAATLAKAPQLSPLTDADLRAFISGLEGTVLVAVRAEQDKLKAVFQPGPSGAVSEHPFAQAHPIWGRIRQLHEIGLDKTCTGEPYRFVCWFLHSRLLQLQSNLEVDLPLSHTAPSMAAPSLNAYRLDSLAAPNPPTLPRDSAAAASASGLKVLKAAVEDISDASWTKTFLADDFSQIVANMSRTIHAHIDRMAKVLQSRSFPIDGVEELQDAKSYIDQLRHVKELLTADRYETQLGVPPSLDQALHHYCTTVQHVMEHEIRPLFHPHQPQAGSAPAQSPPHPGPAEAGNGASPSPGTRPTAAAATPIRTVIDGFRFLNNITPLDELQDSLAQCRSLGHTFLTALHKRYGEELHTLFERIKGPDAEFKDSASDTRHQLGSDFAARLEELELLTTQSHDIPHQITDTFARKTHGRAAHRSLLVHWHDELNKHHTELSRSLTACERAGHIGAIPEAHRICDIAEALMACTRVSDDYKAVADRAQQLQRDLRLLVPDEIRVDIDMRDFEAVADKLRTFTGLDDRQVMSRAQTLIHECCTKHLEAVRNASFWRPRPKEHAQSIAQGASEACDQLAQIRRHLQPWMPAHLQDSINSSLRISTEQFQVTLRGHLERIKSEKARLQLLSACNLVSDLHSFLSATSEEFRSSLQIEGLVAEVGQLKLEFTDVEAMYVEKAKASKVGDWHSRVDQTPIYLLATLPHGDRYATLQFKLREIYIGTFEEALESVRQRLQSGRDTAACLETISQLQAVICKFHHDDHKELERRLTAVSEKLKEKTRRDSLRVPPVMNAATLANASGTPVATIAKESPAATGLSKRSTLPVPPTGAKPLTPRGDSTAQMGAGVRPAGNAPNIPIGVPSAIPSAAPPVPSRGSRRHTAVTTSPPPPIRPRPASTVVAKHIKAAASAPDIRLKPALPARPVRAHAASTSTSNLSTIVDTGEQPLAGGAGRLGVGTPTMYTFANRKHKRQPPPPPAGPVPSWVKKVAPPAARTPPPPPPGPVPSWVKNVAVPGSPARSEPAATPGSPPDDARPGPGSRFVKKLFSDLRTKFICGAGQMDTEEEAEGPRELAAAAAASGSAPIARGSQEIHSVLPAGQTESDGQMHVGSMMRRSPNRLACLSCGAPLGSQPHCPECGN